MAGMFGTKLSAEEMLRESENWREKLKILEEPDFFRQDAAVLKAREGGFLMEVLIPRIKNDEAWFIKEFLPRIESYARYIKMKFKDEILAKQILRTKYLKALKHVMSKQNKNKMDELDYLGWLKSFENQFTFSELRNISAFIKNAYKDNQTARQLLKLTSQASLVRESKELNKFLKIMDGWDDKINTAMVDTKKLIKIIGGKNYKDVEFTKRLLAVDILKQFIQFKNEEKLLYHDIFEIKKGEKETDWKDFNKFYKVLPIQIKKIRIACGDKHTADELEYALKDTKHYGERPSPWKKLMIHLYNQLNNSRTDIFNEAKKELYNLIHQRLEELKSSESFIKQRVQDIATKRIEKIRESLHLLRKDIFAIIHTRFYKLEQWRLKEIHLLRQTIDTEDHILAAQISSIEEIQKKLDMLKYDIDAYQKISAYNKKALEWLYGLNVKDAKKYGKESILKIKMTLLQNMANRKKIAAEIEQIVNLGPEMQNAARTLGTEYKQFMQKYIKNP